MSKTPYQRVDLDRLAAQSTQTARARETGAGGSWRRWAIMILPLVVVLCTLQSVTVVLAENIQQVYMASTLIAVIGFIVLLVIVLLVNPLIRVTFRGRLATFSRVELVSLFAVLMVSFGIPTFGLTSQLVPIIPTPWNPQWNTPQRGWQEDLLPHLNRKLYITDPDQVRLYREGVAVAQPAERAGLGEHLAYYRQVFDAIPWGLWLEPIGYWMIFVGACYGAFYFLSHVVISYWSGREKLIFPLAQLPEVLLPGPDDRPGRWPAGLRSAVFWFGLLLSAAVLSWNACVAAQWIVGLDRIYFGMASGRVAGLVEGTSLEGLRHGMGFVFSFFAIGIAFLVPLEISFSVWFYFLVGQAIFVVATWMNYSDFPTDWIWFNNPVSALGGGGLLLFSAVSLVRSLGEYAHLGRGQTMAARIGLALPVIGLLACLAIVVGWLCWNGLNLLWACLFIGVTILVTLGIMRIVAEAGIFWIQSHVSFFHLYKMLGLGHWLKPALLGPLLPIYWVLFLDIKTFIAPSLMNASKMHQDVGGSRARFHSTIVIGIVVTVVVSLTLAIFLAYMRGAQQMSGWFYSAGPQGTMDTARLATRTAPQFDGATTGFYAAGAAWVAVSMFARQVLFWFPHPVGFIMHINPLMGPVWFSFFVAWVCKKLVVRYGGKATYEKVRLFFLGLIIGELLAVFVWPALGVLFGFQVPGIDLNRYGP